MKSIYRLLVIFVKGIIVLPIFIVYLMSKDNKSLIEEDIKEIIRFSTNKKIKHFYYPFFQLMAFDRSFRSQVYWRLKPWSFVLGILPKERCLTINVPPGCIGGGLYIHHGHSTRISARKIGKNLSIHHNCSIAHGKGGTPIIGDNVFIGTCAVIMGAITIGDNVNIGANATVFKNVPSNTTVVSPSAFISKRDGKRVHEEL